MLRSGRGAVVVAARTPTGPPSGCRRARRSPPPRDLARQTSMTGTGISCRAVGEQSDRGSGSRALDVAHQNLFGVFAPAGRQRRRRSGMASRGVSPRGVPGDDRGDRARVSRNIQWHSGIGGQGRRRVRPAAASRPARSARRRARPRRRHVRDPGCPAVRTGASVGSAAPPRRRARPRLPRRFSSAPAPPGRSPAGVPASVSGGTDPAGRR